MLAPESVSQRLALDEQHCEPQDARPHLAERVLARPIRAFLFQPPPGYGQCRLFAQLDLLRILLPDSLLAFLIIASATGIRQRRSIAVQSELAQRALYASYLGTLSTAHRAITLRTNRFHDGNAPSSSAIGQPKASHRPRATPGDRLTPALQWTTMRSTCCHCSTNRRTSLACSGAKRTSSAAGLATMSLNASRKTATKAGESRAAATRGSLIEIQTSAPCGAYCSAASRESTRNRIRCATTSISAK